jgi:hypothetical protein
MYYTTKIAPDICNAARELASHLQNCNEEHWKALERCVDYITNDKYNGLTYRIPRNLTSISAADSDYAKDENDRKSIGGRVNTLGGMITNWTSKKQATVALSSTEAEYQSLSDCVQEAIFTQNLIEEITGEFHTAILYEDNLGAIYLLKNQQISPRTKHIDIRHHFMRNLYEEKKIDIRFIRTLDNPADIATKNTDVKTHERHADAIRNGHLKWWMEDVKGDSSVTQFGPETETPSE